jgi:DNA-binding NarL/FixJ family response regulator
MDGWQVAQRLRRLSPDRPAVLMLSANAIDASRLTGPERVYDDYLMKPIDLRQLLKKIHALLNIEWVYEEKASPPSPPQASAPGLVPHDRDLDELIGLGEIGHVAKIHEKLSAILRHSPQCAEFVYQMRSLVNAFDLKRYVFALEAIRRNHA